MLILNIEGWLLFAVCSLVFLSFFAFGKKNGTWSQVLIHMNFFFSVLLAFNYFEAVAGFLDKASAVRAFYWDSVAFVLVFSLSFLIFEMLGESLSKIEIPYPKLFGTISKYFFIYLNGALIVVVLASVLMPLIPHCPWEFGAKHQGKLTLGTKEYQLYSNGSLAPFSSEAFRFDSGTSGGSFHGRQWAKDTAVYWTRLTSGTWESSVSDPYMKEKSVDYETKK